MPTFGYVRVSTREQNEDRQMIAMRDVYVPKDNIYLDKVSGKDFDRPQYQALLQRLKKGDLLYIKSIDRLGRNYEDVQEQWRHITKTLDVDICVIDMPLLDTRRGKDLIGTFVSDLVLQVLSFVAENERVNIRQRQAEGIAAAKARGVRFGRPRVVIPPDFPEIVAEWEAGCLPFQVALTRSGLTEATFYRRVLELRAANRSAEERARKAESFDVAYSRWRYGEITGVAAAELCELSPNTFRRKANERMREESQRSCQHG